MKKLQWVMMLLFVSVIIQGAMAQSSSSSSDEAIMLTSSDINDMDQDHNNQILLSNLLSTLEEHFDVTFLYKDEVMVNKYVPKDNIRIDKKTGQELSQILEQLGITFQRIDEQTYVLLNKNLSLQIAQVQEEISGTVTDGQSGEPLPGVNVMVKGTSRGTSTDANGNFELTVESLQDTLVFSFIGYQTLEISLNGRTEINIKMQSEALIGEEMVVTALGINREARALGYSTSTVDSEELTVNRTPNFANALQGEMAGVNVSQLGTGPQGSSKIRIRGLSSFGGNNSPLIVVNGVPIDNTSFGVEGDVVDRGTSRNSDSGDGLSSINPDDIEDITVLKGAAAAALYGSRAKDGVVMISTKQRSQGNELIIEFNTNFTNETPLDYTDYQYEYGQGENGIRPTSPDPVSGQWSFGEKFEPGMTQILFDGVEVPYEPQRNHISNYYRTGSNLTNSISISSGGESGGFNLSYSNLASESILPGSNYKRNTVNIGFTQTIAEKLTISGNVNYSNEDRRNPPNIAEQDYSPVVIYNLANSMPLSVLKKNAFTEDGDEYRWSRFSNRTNPYFALTRFENNIRDRIFGNITTRYELSDWAYIQGRVGQDFYNRDQDYNLPTGSQRQPAPPPGFVNGQYVQDQMHFRESNIDLLIGMNHSIGNIGVDVLLGGNQMHQKRERNNVLAQDFYTRGLYSLGNARSLDPQYSISERQVNSLYSSAEISYKDLLFVTGTARNDWFSTLSPENRSILYPSISTSFVFSDAFESGIPDWVDYGSIRLSYAEVGSDTDVPPYSNNLFYRINTNLFNGSPLGAIIASTVPNANLKPMRVSEWEVGLDLKMFNNILDLEISYYDKITSDQILSAQISDASGYQNQLINVGESQNRGLEVLTTISPIRHDHFNWNSSINLAYNTSKVLDLGDAVSDGMITVENAEFHGELRQVEGLPMGQLYGYDWQYDDQGRQIFDEGNGRPLPTNEQVRFGSAVPVWTGGINNKFNYRGISMSFLIDFKLGHKMISGTHINAYRHGLDKATLVGREQGYVVGDGVNPDGSVNTTQSGVQTFYETIRSLRTSGQSVFNAGYWQLRKITIGYDLTKHLPKNFGIRGVRLSAVANNVAVLKKWVPHIHPDQAGYMSDHRMGLEATGLPITRSLGFNLNIEI